jgi:hypothetical protein
MITNFLSSKNNIISDYILNNNINAYFSKKEINDAENVRRQQDRIVDICISSLIKTIYNNIKLSKNKPINIDLPIKNVLWTLWNSSWQLGTKHANNEIYSNFNSDINTVNFVEEEKKQRNVSKSRIPNIEKVKRRKEEEQRINRENNITPLQESEFGKIYLEKRLQRLSSNLNTYYREQLTKDNTLDKYFKSKKIFNAMTDEKFVNELVRLGALPRESKKQVLFDIKERPVLKTEMIRLMFEKRDDEK